ncbi:MAG TPA: hypothetical protein VFN18_10500 [Solirubrobacterales bacterium]|nr:hypothetical protein [Solirubrobacterales bacterium]
MSVHPIKVAILEAMVWLARPVSPVELHKMFEYPDDLSTLSYHVARLLEMGAIEKISDRPVRGARETFYFLTAAAMTADGDVKSPASPK